MENKMNLEEANEILKFKDFCVDHCCQGQLWIYDKLFNKALKIIKKNNKK